MSSACRPDLPPLRAVYTWPNGQHFAFEVSRLTRRSDFNPSAFSVPPAGAEFRQSELRHHPRLPCLSENELAELRLRPSVRSDKPDPSAPKNGLLLVNHSEGLRYITLDGVLDRSARRRQRSDAARTTSRKVPSRSARFLRWRRRAAQDNRNPARFSLGDDAEGALRSLRNRACGRRLRSLPDRTPCLRSRCRSTSRVAPRLLPRAPRSESRRKEFFFRNGRQRCQALRQKLVFLGRDAQHRARTVVLGVAVDRVVGASDRVEPQKHGARAHRPIVR